MAKLIFYCLNSASRHNYLQYRTTNALNTHLSHLSIQLALPRYFGHTARHNHHFTSSRSTVATAAAKGTNTTKQRPKRSTKTRESFAVPVIGVSTTQQAPENFACWKEWPWNFSVKSEQVQTLFWAVMEKNTKHRIWSTGRWSCGSNLRFGSDSR